MTYVAYTSGRGAKPTTVYARDADDGPEWQPVGLIAAGSPDAADESSEMLVGAALLQRRLIAEHACRIYPSLRDAKRRDAIELAVELTSGDPESSTAATAAIGIIRPVPSSELGDVTPEQMLRCGFAGAVLPPKPGCRPSRGIYHDFAAQKINPAYNRHDVAEQLAAKRRPAGDSTEDGEEEPILIEQRPSFTLFAWKHCGFCTKAITALETRGLPFERIIIDKFSAEHAELR